jgi:hypothetical protein
LPGGDLVPGYDRGRQHLEEITQQADRQTAGVSCSPGAHLSQDAGGYFHRCLSRD